MNAEEIQNKIDGIAKAFAESFRRDTHCFHTCPQCWNELKQEILSLVLAAQVS